MDDTQDMPRPNGAIIIPFPLPSPKAVPARPVERLAKALTDLSAALTEQRAALLRWRAALQELQARLEAKAGTVN